MLSKDSLSVYTTAYTLSHTCIVLKLYYKGLLTIHIMFNVVKCYQILLNSSLKPVLMFSSHSK